MNKERSVTVKGESINKTIKKGLSLLGCSKEDVEVEVLEEGRKGFLGFGRRLFKVRLSLLESLESKDKPKESSLDSEQESIEKKLIELKDNQLILSQQIEDRYPVVKAEAGIKLYVDDKKVDDWVILSEDKEIRVEVINQEAVSDIEIRVSDDKLAGYLKVIQKAGHQFEPKLIESNPKEYMVVAEKITDIKPSKVELDDIYNKLAELKISYGLKHNNIQKALKEPNQEVLIAEGKEVVASKDSEINYLFNDRQEAVDDSKDKVDYFTINQVYSVQRGELIATKEPKMLGEAGYTIFNEKIEVKPPKDIEWLIDEESVEIINDKAIALKEGRPTIDKGKLSVLEIFEVSGDVDMSVGNIDFHGDVIVGRDVCDNFKIRATGKIIVGNNVSNAYLESEQGVEVKGNIIGSEIIVGKLSVYYKKAHEHLSKLLERIQLLDLALKELVSNQAFKTEDIKLKGYKAVIQILISSKFTDLYDILKNFDKLNQDIDQDELFEELKLLSAKLKKLFNLTGICYINTLSELNELKELISIATNILASIKVTKPEITAKYVQNSTLTASGDISILGEGVYNSQLSSDAKVEISGNPGFFRGGKIKAGEDIRVKELGSSSGSQVEVIIPEDKRVIADKLFINVSIRIGDKKYKSQKDLDRVSAHLNDSGKLILF